VENLSVISMCGNFLNTVWYTKQKANNLSHQSKSEAQITFSLWKK